MDSVNDPRAITPTLWPAHCFSQGGDADPRDPETGCTGSLQPSLLDGLLTDVQESTRSLAPEGPREGADAKTQASSQDPTSRRTVRFQINGICDSPSAVNNNDTQHKNETGKQQQQNVARDVEQETQPSQPPLRRPPGPRPAAGAGTASPASRKAGGGSGLLLPPPPRKSLDSLLVMHSVQVDDEDLHSVLGPVGRLAYMKNRRGLRLACYFWPATTTTTTGGTPKQRELTAPAAPSSELADRPAPCPDPSGSAANGAATTRGPARGPDEAPAPVSAASPASAGCHSNGGMASGQDAAGSQPRPGTRDGSGADGGPAAGPAAAAAAPTNGAGLQRSSSRAALTGLPRRSRSVAAACLLSHAFSVASQLSMDPDLDLELEMDSARFPPPGDAPAATGASPVLSAVGPSAVGPNPVIEQPLPPPPPQQQQQRSRQRPCNAVAPAHGNEMHVPGADTREATAGAPAAASAWRSGVHGRTATAESSCAAMMNPRRASPSPFGAIAAADEAPQADDPGQAAGGGSCPSAVAAEPPEPSRAGARWAAASTGRASEAADGVRTEEAAAEGFVGEGSGAWDGPEGRPDDLRCAAAGGDGGKSARSEAGGDGRGSSGGGDAAPEPVEVLERPKGVVVLVHGHGAYLCWDFLRTECPGSLPRYDGSWVEHLNLQGYAVCGIDLQGAGRSEGYRCYIERFEHYVQDVVDFTLALQQQQQHQPAQPATQEQQHQQQQLQQQQSQSTGAATQGHVVGRESSRSGDGEATQSDEASDSASSDNGSERGLRESTGDNGPERGLGESTGDGTLAAVVRGFPADPRVAPRFILGLSLGGGIATHVMHHTGTSLFAGAVLLSPMISLQGMASRGPNVLLRLAAAALNVLYPHLPLVRGEPNRVFPLIQQLWDSDPSCFKQGTRVRNALEYLRACQQLCAELHLTDFPFLVFHSARDRWTDAHGSRALFERSRSPDKTLVSVDHMYHILTKEDGWREVLAEAVRWLDAHTEALRPPL